MAFAQLISSTPPSLSHNKPSANAPASTASLSPLPSARSSRPSQQPLAHSTEASGGGPTPSSGAAPPRSRRNTTLQISILLRRRRAPTLPRFPGAILPLQIFEFRCRIMIHTLLQTDLRFGVIYTDATSGTANVGCVGEIVRHERLLDDRFFLICKGQVRFRVTCIVRTKPYLVAQVTWLEDRPSGDGGGDDLETLASEVESYMKDVIRLSNRLSGKPEKEVQGTSSRRPSPSLRGAHSKYIGFDRRYRYSTEAREGDHEGYSQLPECSHGCEGCFPIFMNDRILGGREHGH